MDPCPCLTWTFCLKLTFPLYEFLEKVFSCRYTRLNSSQKRFKLLWSPRPIFSYGDEYSTDRHRQHHRLVKFAFHALIFTPWVKKYITKFLLLHWSIKIFSLSYCKFTGECKSEKKLKVDQYLMKLWQKLGGVLFWFTVYERLYYATGIRLIKRVRTSTCSVRLMV